MNNPKHFPSNVVQLHTSAFKNIAHGAATRANKANVLQTIEILQSVIATELVSVLRYTQNAIAATGISSEVVKANFKEHAAEDHDHVLLVAERINELGGSPNLRPEGISTRLALQYATGSNLHPLFRKHLIAEQIACQHYRVLVRTFADNDPKTSELMEHILQKKEEHANDMHDLIVARRDMPTRSSKATI